MKTFNTTGVCIPEKHYMVDLTERVAEIRRMVDAGDYFCINRARQYGKTTTLTALRKKLADRYTVVSLDFQGIGDAGFRTEQDFSQSFCGLIKQELRTGLVLPKPVEDKICRIADTTPPVTKLMQLFEILTDWCDMSDQPVVLLIDEVDSATNNQVFLDFLAQLRRGYIDRDAKGIPAFQSVILAGVTDVKHLKSKIRDDEQHKVNSPWNIATDFTVDMRLHQNGIAQMLDEYASDRTVSFKTGEVSGIITDYTDGYPFLVSRICQLIDTQLVPDYFPTLSEAWSGQGITAAVNLLLKEGNVPLFESLIGKLQNYPELRDAIRSVLMQGESMDYLPYNEAQSQLRMYGFIRVENQKAVIDNRIFETLLYDYFLGEIQTDQMRQHADLDKNRFVENGRLNMPLVLERFIDTYTGIFGPLQERFPEKDGRELFLLYLRPIINGVGHYYIEAQTRDRTRTDVIVDYRGEQFIIEMKIWRGNAYHERGEQQIKEYLDYFGLDTGYLLSFNFNRQKNTGVKQVLMDGKTVYEAMV